MMICIFGLKIKTKHMANKSISLSYNCWGKSITIKHDSSILRVDDLFSMFKGIVIAEYGQKQWEEMILFLGDKIYESENSRELFNAEI